METSSEVVGLAPISTLVLASVVGLPYEPRIFFFFFFSGLHSSGESCYLLQQSRGDDKNRLARLFRAGSRCVAMGGLIQFPRDTPRR